MTDFKKYLCRCNDCLLFVNPLICEKIIFFFMLAVVQESQTSCNVLSTVSPF